MTTSSTTDLQNLRLRPSYNFTRASRISGISFTRQWTLHAPATRRYFCWCHLTSYDDVIISRQQPRKHVHVSPSSRQWHVIGWCQQIYYSTRDPTQKPGTDPNQYPLTLTLDQLTLTFLRWPLTKSQNFRQGLSCSVFRVDSNFELHFFIWNSKIGQLAYSSLWFLQRLYSWYLQEIFLCLSNLKPSSSFRLEFEGGC